MRTSTRLLALAGTLAFVVAALLTVVDIVLRSVSTATVDGLTDIVSLCTMIGAMLAIPYGFATDQQVSVDVFTARMNPRAQRWLLVASAIMGTIFLAGVFWFSTEQMLVEASYGDRSQSIGIPMVWYWIPLLLGVGLSVLVTLWLAVRLAFRPE